MSPHKYLLLVNECNNLNCEIGLKTGAINITNTDARTDAFMIVAPFLWEAGVEHCICMVSNSDPQGG